jgi:hypothetical protein
LQNLVETKNPKQQNIKIILEINFNTNLNSITSIKEMGFYVE